MNVFSHGEGLSTGLKSGIWMFSLLNDEFVRSTSSVEFHAHVRKCGKWFKIFETEFSYLNRRIHRWNGHFGTLDWNRVPWTVLVHLVVQWYLSQSPLTLSQFEIRRYKTLTWNSEILRCRPLESLILVLKHTARFGFWFFLWSSQFFFQKRTARVYQFGNSKSRLPLR